MTHIFTLEGNIGAGKSTLIERLKHTTFNKPHYIMLEPVDKWMATKPNPDQPSLFELYYNDKKRYAFMFQMFALQSRMEHLDSIIRQYPSHVIICERCFLTDYEIFAKMLHDQKYISDAEYFVYKSWYDFMMHTMKPKVSGVIYLRADPDVCATRIIKRDRKGEDNIDVGYLKQLHKQHETWLNKSSSAYPVHIVDGNGPNIDIDSILGFVNHNIADS